MSFTAGVLKYDPYRNFKFLIKFDGTNAVAGVSKISALTQSVEAIPWRMGGDPNYVQQLPGQTKYEPITLERGKTADTTFMDWINTVATWNAAGGKDGEHTNDFRKDIVIEMYSLSNSLVAKVNVYKAWPSKFIALPDLDAKANEVAIETLELQHEGFVITPTAVSDGPRSS